MGLHRLSIQMLVCSTQQQHMWGMAYPCIRRMACMAYSHMLCSSWRCGVLDILDPGILDGMRHRAGHDPRDIQMDDIPRS
jgi:hypothetical protein